MKYTNCHSILSINVTVGDIKPSSSFTPQLSPKGIKGADFCNLLNEKLTGYKDGDIVNIRIYYGTMVSGKAPWYVEIKGKLLNQIIRETLGIQKFNQQHEINHEQVEEIYNSMLNDPNRVQHDKMRKSLLGTLKGYNIIIKDE